MLQPEKEIKDWEPTKITAGSKIYNNQEICFVLNSYIFITTISSPRSFHPPNKKAPHCRFLQFSFNDDVS